MKTCPMRDSRTGFLLLGLSAILLAGCGRGQAPIPAGAQEVHVTVTDSEVRLDPTTASAGDIYVVMDIPGSGVFFVRRQTSAEETPGPLTDDDLARITLGGDAQGFAMSGFAAGGCDASQDVEDFGRLGPCGNVELVVLSAGKYVFYSGVLELGPPSSMAILDVLP